MKGWKDAIKIVQSVHHDCLVAIQFNSQFNIMIFFTFFILFILLLIFCVNEFFFKLNSNFFSVFFLFFQQNKISGWLHKKNIFLPSINHSNSHHPHNPSSITSIPKKIYLHPLPVPICDYVFFL